MISDTLFFVWYYLYLHRLQTISTSRGCWTWRARLLLTWSRARLLRRSARPSTSRTTSPLRRKRRSAERTSGPSSREALEPLIPWCLGFVVPITLQCLLLCVVVMVVSILGVAVVLVWEQVLIILGKNWCCHWSVILNQLSLVKYHEKTKWLLP